MALESDIILIPVLSFYNSYQIANESKQIV